MKRRQSLLPRPRENWITYFPNWAENLALCQTLEKLEQAEKTAEDKLAALLEQLRGAPQDDPALSAAVVKAANDAESKRRQADAVNKLVDAGLAQNQAEAGALIARAVSAAAERAEEVQTILGRMERRPR